MATLFVRHKVKEFGDWKIHYDEFNAERETLGVVAHGVYQDENNPNDVTIYHRFKTMDAAKAFIGNPRLKEVMEGAGVVGPPDMWFTNEA